MWENESFDEAWNFGPSLSDDPQKIHIIVEKIIKKFGSGTWQDISDKKSFKESNLLLLNSQKAQNRLGWHPIFDIDNAISETVDWYKKYHDNPEEIESYSEKCIESYMKKAKEIKNMIDNAGVSSFYLGKKGLAYITDIDTREARN